MRIFGVEEPISYALVYIGGYTFLVFLAICLATGLYYLAELVEEYASLTKRIIKWTTLGVLVTHLLLWIIDGLPFQCIAIGIVSHLVYSLLLRTFPFISLTSVEFLASCVMLLVSHWAWMRYFMSVPYYTIEYVMGFFLLVVWIVPFGYFISLAANESVLPMQSLDGSGGGGGGGMYGGGGSNSTDETTKSGKKSRGGLLSFMKMVKKKGDQVLPGNDPFRSGNKTL